MQGFAVRRTCRNGGICRFEAHTALCRPAYRVKHCGAVSLPAVPQCSGTGCPHGYAVRRANCDAQPESIPVPSAAPAFSRTITLHDEASDSDFTISAVDLWSVLPPARCPQPGRMTPCWPRWLPAAAMRCTYPLRGRALPPTALVQRLDQQRGSAKPLGQ